MSVSTTLVALVLVAVAVVVALVIRSRTDRRPARGRWPVPTQLERTDFARPDLPLAMVLFTSATCDACGQVRSAITSLPEDLADRTALDDVVVQERPELHERYGVEAVPTLVLVDSEGIVRASWVGPVPREQLHSAIEVLAAGQGG